MDSILPFLVLIALFIFIVRREIRREMIIAGLLVAPLILLKPLIASEYYEVSRQYGGIIYFVITRFLVAFCFGALAAALYEVFIRHRLTPEPHPRRRDLLMLLIGPILVLVITLLGQPFIAALAIAFVVDCLLLFFFRRELLWDALFSGIAMGVLYLIVYLISHQAIPGQIDRLWFTNTLSGITFLGLPLEEVFAAGFLGAIIGPLYPAIKSIWVQPTAIPFKPSFAKVAIGQLFLGFFAYILMITVYQFAFPPLLVAATGHSGDTIGIHEPLEITFNRPIRRQSIGGKLTAITDTTPFDLTPSQSNGRFSRRVRLVPEKALTPDTEYVLNVTNVESLWKTTRHDYALRFRTEAWPKIVTTVPAKEATNAEVCNPLKISFDLPIQTDQVKYTLEPPIDFSVDAVGLNEHSIQPSTCLQGDTAYRLLVLVHPQDNASPESVSFKTKSGVHVISYAPSGNSIGLDIPEIELNFSEPMKQEGSLPTLEPALAGKWQWQTSTKLVFNLATRLPVQSPIFITVPKEMATIAGELFKDNVSVSFKTVGPPMVLKSSPATGAKEVAPDSRITLTFSQAVDHSSAESAFSMSPSVSGAFSWQDQTMIFQPTNLQTNTSYTINLKDGIRGQYSLISAQTFKITFSTQTTTTLLNIGVDYQDKALSCEAAALKMALVGKGVSVSEDSIMAYVGYDATVRSGNQWGDPDVAFVGSINGRQNSTGYGVHWEPIARAARALGRKATAFSGLAPKDLAREISSNNPVVIWGTQGSAVYDPWYTPGGKLVAAWKGEHARTVIGFKGSVDDPTHFILNDPIAGRITWTTSQLKANWGRFNNSGVIIY